MESETYEVWVEGPRIKTYRVDLDRTLEHAESVRDYFQGVNKRNVEAGAPRKTYYIARVRRERI